MAVAQRLDTPTHRMSMNEMTLKECEDHITALRTKRREAIEKWKGIDRIARNAPKSVMREKLQRLCDKIKRRIDKAEKDIATSEHELLKARVLVVELGE